MRPISLLALISSTTLILAQQQQQRAPICEDTIDSQPPFNNNNIPCLLGCGLGEPRATGSLLPGSINETAIPYCRLNCVRPSGAATPAQSSAAPACNDRCERINSATPDQLGWCIYWCVQGGEIERLVVSTTCIPSIQYTPVATETTDGITLTVQEFTMPTQWASWYKTQTVIPRTSPLAFAPTSTISNGASSSSSESTSTSLKGFCGTSEYEVACPSTSSTISMTAMASTTSKAMLSSSTTAMTGDAQEDAQSSETQAVSTTTQGSGVSLVYGSGWMLQAVAAWVIAWMS